MNLLPKLLVFPWIFLALLIILLFLVAPILIGFVVYRDAKKRHVSSPLLWTVIAALVPFYVGLLLYALIGSTQIDQNHP